MKITIDADTARITHPSGRSATISPDGEVLLSRPDKPLYALFNSGPLVGLWDMYALYMITRTLDYVHHGARDTLSYTDAIGHWLKHGELLEHDAITYTMG